MLALRDLQTHQSSDAISNGDTHHVPLTEEDIVQRVRKPRSGYIRGRGKILKGSSSSSGAQSENDEVVVELKNKLASYENKLDACTSFIQQLTSQLNMQFPGCFAQFDPRTTFSLPLPPQHPSQDDDDDDDAYRPVISRDPCYFTYSLNLLSSRINLYYKLLLLDIDNMLETIMYVFFIIS